MHLVPLMLAFEILIMRLSHEKRDCCLKLVWCANEYMSEETEEPEKSELSLEESMTRLAAAELDIQKIVDRSVRGSHPNLNET
jgi:hypothetical protein